jgi:multidrug efflux pump subunit AcrA (membrane-fusion protein)
MFRDSRFEPVTVEVGIANDSSTELVSGPIAPGDRLVTAAAVAK